MNSLTYLSRQFDVLASAKTPPSTPSSEHPPLKIHSVPNSPKHTPTPSPSSSAEDLTRLRNGNGSLGSRKPSSRPGLPSWSLKALVAPPPAPRRTLTSPARIPTPTSTKAEASSSSASTSTLSEKLPSTPSHTSPSPPVASSPPSSPTMLPLQRRPKRSASIRAKSHPQRQSLFQRIFFVRVLILVWDSICAAAASVRVTIRAWHGDGLQGGRVTKGTHVRGGEGDADETEKDSEGEGDDEKRPLIAMQQLDEPAHSSLNLTPPHPPLVTRSQTESTLVEGMPPSAHSDPRLHLDSQSLLPNPLVASLFPFTQSHSRPTTPSRTPTPTALSTQAGQITPRKTTPFHMQKTLVLDLDETLIHSTSRPLYNTSGSGGLLGGLGLGGLLGGSRRSAKSHMVEVVLGGRSTCYHVYKRPYVDYFLRKVSTWYTLVIFTASMQEYADPVIDWLDAGRGILGRRFFRESCTLLPNGSYSKDLSVVEQDLSKVCLIDNSPVCYAINETNGIPIEGWTHDPHDEALLDLLPVLDSLRFTSDVRRVLGIRGFISSS